MATLGPELEFMGRFGGQSARSIPAVHVLVLTVPALGVIRTQCKNVEFSVLTRSHVMVRIVPRV